MSELIIKGLHHAALSVEDLDRSIAFYCEHLGMELVRRGEFSGEAMENITALAGTRGRGAMLRAGTMHLELFEFAVPAPTARLQRRRACDYGISHFCLEVFDLHKTYARLSARGVEFHCPPQSFGDMQATYARDPDGNIFELLQMPEPTS